MDSGIEFKDQGAHDGGEVQDDGGGGCRHDTVVANTLHTTSFTLDFNTLLTTLYALHPTLFTLHSTLIGWRVYMTGVKSRTMVVAAAATTRSLPTLFTLQTTLFTLHTSLYTLLSTHFTLHS